MTRPVCRCGFDASCRRHSDLTDIEMDVVTALTYADYSAYPYLPERFYAGEVEEIVLVLRDAGFRVSRVE